MYVTDVVSTVELSGGPSSNGLNSRLVRTTGYTISLANSRYTMQWLVSAAFSCSVLGDLGLACILSLVLHVSRTGMKR